MKIVQTIVLFVAMALLSAHAQEPSIQQLLRDFPTTQLVIRTPDARQHRFDVWVATNDRHRAQGLMYVRELPPQAGMLFIYSQPQRVGMWMKNTYIPLDMVFIRADGRIAQIEVNTKPHSLDTVQANEDVIAVLELNAGTAKRLNIRPGALIDKEVLRLTSESRRAS